MAKETGKLGRIAHRRSGLASGGLAALVAALAACAVAGPAGASTKTTAPDTPYNVPVSITDKKITIHETLRQFTDHGTTRFPRSAIINFVVTNKGTVPHAVRLALLSKHVFTKYERKVTVISGRAIAPGHRLRFPINFYYRGSFALQVMSGSKPSASARIVVY